MNIEKINFYSCNYVNFYFYINVNQGINNNLVIYVVKDFNYSVLNFHKELIEDKKRDRLEI